MADLEGEPSHGSATGRRRTCESSGSQDLSQIEARRADDAPSQDDGEDVELILRCREIFDVASAAANELRGPLAAVADEDRLVYTFKNRLKPTTSILSKVKRKREEEARERASSASAKTGGEGARAYGPDQVTDAWGCRYVTLYQSQIPPAIEALIDAISRYNEGKAAKVELLEFVIYTNRPAGDPLSIVDGMMEYIKQSSLYTNSLNPHIKQPENRKSAYSSVHVVCKLPVTVNQAGRGKVSEVAKFEIQVRDIFEEGWGEIQHDLIYSGKDRPEETEDASGFAPLWRPHLNALKTFVDGCSQHASIIKQTYEFLQLRNMPSLDTKSTSDRPDDRTAILAALKGNKFAAARELIDLAYDLLIEAQAYGSQ